MYLKMNIIRIYYIFVFLKRLLDFEAGEKVQWVRALFHRSLVQFPASTWQLANACNSSSRDLDSVDTACTCYTAHMQAKHPYT